MSEVIDGAGFVGGGSVACGFGPFLTALSDTAVPAKLNAGRGLIFPAREGCISQADFNGNDGALDTQGVWRSLRAGL